MKAETPLQAGELIDCSRMSVKALREYFEKEIKACKVTNILFVFLFAFSTNENSR